MSGHSLKIKPPGILRSYRELSPVEAARVLVDISAARDFNARAERAAPDQIAKCTARVRFAEPLPATANANTHATALHTLMKEIELVDVPLNAMERQAMQTSYERTWASRLRDAQCKERFV